MGLKGATRWALAADASTAAAGGGEARSEAPESSESGLSPLFLHEHCQR
ncbi:hypothetical protein ACLI4Z_16890 (plasmid) [Natrialbaceae archaeon A-arb3/5]